MEIKDQKDFDITNTIDAEALAKRWGVTKKTIDNRRLKGERPNHWKITGKQCLVNTLYYHHPHRTNGRDVQVCLS